MKLLSRAAVAVCLLLSITASASAFTPVNGHWWNPNESGSGYNIDVRNGVLVMTIYSYRTDGNADWYLASGPVSADQRHFTGTLDRYGNGQCISCSYSGSPRYAGNAGTVSINFVSEKSAVLTLPGGRVTAIEPFFPTLSFSSRLDGSYRLARSTVDYLGGSLLDTEAGTLLATGTMTISGNRVTQTLAVTINGNAVSITLSGTFVDHGAFIVISQNGASRRIPLITRAGAILATESVNALAGATPAFAEVDQCELVGGPGSMAKETISSVPDTASLGGGIGAALTRLVR
jgi:hypothetical protein